MKLWITAGNQFLAQTRSLLIVLGLLEVSGEHTWYAPFLCCEAPLCAEAARHSHEDHR